MSTPLPLPEAAKRKRTKAAAAKDAGKGLAWIAAHPRTLALIAIGLYVACRAGIDVALLTRAGATPPNATNSCCINPEAFTVPPGTGGVSP